MPANPEGSGEAVQPEKVPRRLMNYLLGTGVAGTLASFFYPVIKFIIPPEIAEPSLSTIVAGKIGELRPNSGKIFKFGSKPGIVIETPGGEIRAFSAICTHLACTVQYREDMQEIWHACHNGVYDLNGNNVSGPPPKPLERYTVNVRRDEIVVSKG